MNLFQRWQRNPQTPIENERKLESKTLTQDVSCFNSINNLPYSEYKPEFKALNRASKEPLFSRCREVIEARIWTSDLTIESEDNYQKILSESSITKFYTTIIQKQIFDCLFNNTGQYILYFEGVELIFKPVHINGRAQIKFIWDSENKPIKAEILNIHGIVIDTLESNKFYYGSLSGGKSADSIVLRCLEYLDWMYQNLESQKKLASRGYMPFYTVSPDYSASNNEIINQMIKGWNNMLMSFKSALKGGENLFISQYPFKSTILNQSNSEAKVLEMITEIKSQIITGCGLYPSLVGIPIGSNRALSEQDRDNLFEVTVKNWQNRLLEPVDWILENSVPNYQKELVKVIYKQEETDETIKLRELANNALATATTYIDRGFEFDYQSLASHFSILGLELINANQKAIENAEDYVDSTLGRDLKKDNFFLPEQSKDQK